MRTVQLRDVADHAGVATSAIYKAYANKYELFAYAAELVLAEQMESVIDRVDATAAPIDILETLLVDICDVVSTHPYAAGYAFIGLPFLHRDEVGDEAYESLVALRHDVRARLERRIGDAVATGEIAADPAVAVDFVLSALFGHLGMTLNELTGVTPEEFGRRTIACLAVLR